MCKPGSSFINPSLPHPPTPTPNQPTLSPNPSSSPSTTEPTKPGDKIVDLWYAIYVENSGESTLKSIPYKPDDVNTVINFGTGTFTPGITGEDFNGTGNSSYSGSVILYFSNAYSNVPNKWWNIGSYGGPQWSNDPSFIESINSQITLTYKGGYNGICLDLESGSINGKSLDKIFSHSKTINSKAKTVLVSTGNALGLSNSDMRGCEKNLDYVMFMNYRLAGDSGSSAFDD